MSQSRNAKSAKKGSVLWDGLGALLKFELKFLVRKTKLLVGNTELLDLTMKPWIIGVTCKNSSKDSSKAVGKRTGNERETEPAWAAKIDGLYCYGLCSYRMY